MKTRPKATLDDDDARYVFTDPLHMVFAQAVEKEPPVINCRRLSVTEEKALAPAGLSPS